MRNFLAVLVALFVLIPTLLFAQVPPRSVAVLSEHVLGTDTYTEATTRGFLSGAVRNDTLATLVDTDNEIAPLQVNAEGALFVAGNITSAPGATAKGVVVRLPAEAATNKLFVQLTNGTNNASVDASGNLLVTLGNTLTKADVVALSDFAANRKLGINAEDNAFTNGAAVWAGKVRDTAPTLTNGNLAALTLNRAGVQFVIAGHPDILTTEFMWDAGNTMASDAVITIVPSLKIIVTQIAALCDAANSGAVGVRVGFATTTLAVEPSNGASASTIVLTHPGIAAGSGYNRGSGAGMLGIGGDGEDLRIIAEDPAGGKCRLMVSHYTVGS